MGETRNASSVKSNNIEHAQAGEEVCVCLTKRKSDKTNEVRKRRNGEWERERDGRGRRRLGTREKEIIFNYQLKKSFTFSFLFGRCCCCCRCVIFACHTIRRLMMIIFRFRCLIQMCGMVCLWRCGIQFGPVRTFDDDAINLVMRVLFLFFNIVRLPSNACTRSVFSGSVCVCVWSFSFIQTRTRYVYLPSSFFFGLLMTMMATTTVATCYWHLSSCNREQQQRIAYRINE